MSPTPDAEARQVVVAAAVHAGHFRRFTTGQCRPGQFATACDTGNHGRGNVQVQTAGGVIVEKEKGFGPGYHDVVDTHGDQIDADAVVLLQLHGEPQLGADTVGAGHQHRLPVTVQWQFEQCTEAAQAGHHAGAEGFANHWLDSFHQVVAGVDVDAGLPIAEGRAPGGVVLIH